MCILHHMFCVSWIRLCTANQTSLSCREMYCFVFKWSRVHIFRWIWATSAYIILHIPQSYRQLTGRCIKLDQDSLLPNIGVSWGGWGGEEQNRIWVLGTQTLLFCFPYNTVFPNFSVFRQPEYSFWKYLYILFAPFQFSTQKKNLGKKNIVRIFVPSLCTPKATPMIAHTLQVIID